MNVRMAERTQKTSMPASEQRAEEAAYDASIASIDAELGLLFQELARREVLDRTIVVITSDHGEMFGEHGLFSHGHSLYRPLLHVPLVIVYRPAVAEGVRVDSHISLRDLSATVLGLARVSDHALPGQPLLPADSSRAPSPVLAEVRPAPGMAAHYPAVKGVMHSIEDNGYQYIRDGSGGEELFDLADSAQVSNLASQTGLGPILARLRATLDSVRARD
jgi:arylsulfatase A-like enzyme